MAVVGGSFADKPLLSWRQTGLRVLELGCGAGANIPFFAAINAEYYGIEGSSTQVKRLQEQYMGLSHADKCRGGGGTKSKLMSL